MEDAVEHGKHFLKVHGAVEWLVVDGSRIPQHTDPSV